MNEYLEKAMRERNERERNSSRFNPMTIAAVLGIVVIIGVTVMFVMFVDWQKPFAKEPVDWDAVRESVATIPETKKRAIYQSYCVHVGGAERMISGARQQSATQIRNFDEGRDSAFENEAQVQMHVGGTEYGHSLEMAKARKKVLQEFDITSEQLDLVVREQAEIESQRPGYRREHLWLKWAEEGLTRVQIRDKWNSLPEEERQELSRVASQLRKDIQPDWSDDVSGGLLHARTETLPATSFAKESRLWKNFKGGPVLVTLQGEECTGQIAKIQGNVVSLAVDGDKSVIANLEGYVTVELRNLSEEDRNFVLAQLQLQGK